MDKEKRGKIAILSGIIGICCNLVLCGFKFFTGMISASVSIMADALNNLSDAGSNVVTIIGTKLSQKPVDKEHPFGHGRIEYVSALIVAFLILMMGTELAKASVEKIVHPEELNFSSWNLLVLMFSILVKCGMGFYNRHLYKKTGNINLKAVSQDSFNDCIATFSTAVALLLSHFTSFKQADGIIGVAVSIFVIFSGIEMIKDVLNPLLGQAPSKELVDEIQKIILEQDLILGVHDLIIHEYGAGMVIASAHAEVPDSIDIINIHNAIDEAEEEILEKLNVTMCIHMDPVPVNDKKVDEYKELTAKILDDMNPIYKFHDFKLISDDKKNTLIFDLVVPFEECKKEHEEILKELNEKFLQEDSTVNLMVRVEHSFTE